NCFSGLGAITLRWSLQLPQCIARPRVRLLNLSLTSTDAIPSCAKRTPSLEVGHGSPSILKLQVCQRGVAQYRRKIREDMTVSRGSKVCQQGYRLVQKKTELNRDIAEAHSSLTLRPSGGRPSCRPMFGS